MNIKEIFELSENGSLTYEAFNDLAKESKANFTDLSEGKYVSKNKYEDDLRAKDNAIETLNATISTRDTDLAELKTKLEAAGTDVEKLNTLSSDLSSLQQKYDNDVANYKAQLHKQAYEFAVKDYANSKRFSSNAAKRDFINSMISKELKLEEGKILGADDFANAYSNENADAFIVDTPDEPEPANPKPQFVGSAQGAEITRDNTQEFLDAFNFVAVRPHG